MLIQICGIVIKNGIEKVCLLLSLNMSQFAFESSRFSLYVKHLNSLCTLNETKNNDVKLPT